MKVSIQFGVMTEKIKDQLAKQGLVAGVARLSMWQRQAESVSYLSIHSIISESVVVSARRKILRNIAKHARVRSPR